MSEAIGTVDLSAVLGALHEACFSTCGVKKRNMMNSLEHFQLCDGYVEALVRIINIEDVGATTQMDCRHLAAVLLKNIVTKRGSGGANYNNTNRPLTVLEKQSLKAFLTHYQYEPECKVALQLSLVIARIARQDGDQWLREWPDLIPALIGAATAQQQQQATAPLGQAGSIHADNSNNTLSSACRRTGSAYACLRSLRGISALNELLFDLSSKASTGTAGGFGKGYANLCVQLYPVVSKLWAENMKKLQPVYAKLCSQTVAYQHINSDNVHNYAASVQINMHCTGVDATQVETILVHTVLLSKVLRLLLEFGIEGICSTYTTFFKNFWKSYLGE